MFLLHILCLEQKVSLHLHSSSSPRSVVLIHGVCLVQNIEAQSSDASQLIPQHNYKLDVHALNTRHPGEVFLKLFTEQLMILV